MEDGTFELLTARLQSLNVELDQFVSNLVRADVEAPEVSGDGARRELRAEDLVEMDADVQPELYAAQMRVFGTVR